MNHSDAVWNHILTVIIPFCTVQDMVMFVCPPQFRQNPDTIALGYTGGNIWFGRVRLMYRIAVQTDSDLRADVSDPTGPTQTYFTRLDFAMMECFKPFVDPTRDPSHVVLYQPEPAALVYNIPTGDLKGRINMVLYGDTGTISYSMRGLRGTAYRGDARVDPPGDAGRGRGSPLYHLNTWAMEWARDLDVPCPEPDSESESDGDADEEDEESAFPDEEEDEAPAVDGSSDEEEEEADDDSESDSDSNSESDDWEDREES